MTGNPTPKLSEREVIGMSRAVVGQSTDDSPNPQLRHNSARRLPSAR
jgi:hypothetical protein